MGLLVGLQFSNIERTVISVPVGGLVLTGLVPTITIASFNLDGESITNVLTGVATVWINADGTVDKTDFGGRTQIDSATDWVIPNSVASSDYDVRYTSLTGDPLDVAPAAENVWVDLSVDREFGNNLGNSTFTIEIREPGGETVASGVYSCLAATA